MKRVFGERRIIRKDYRDLQRTVLELQEYRPVWGGMFGRWVKIAQAQGYRDLGNSVDHALKELKQKAGQPFDGGGEVVWSSTEGLK